jgi:thioredoxin 1
MEKHLTSENFNQEVLQSDLPVLVDFWADWCGPCRMVAPAVSSLAMEYQGRLKVCKLNVDEAADIAGKYEVMSIPTFAIFKDGKVVDRFVGSLAKQELIEKVKPYVV